MTDRFHLTICVCVCVCTLHVRLHVHVYTWKTSVGVLTCRIIDTSTMQPAVYNECVYCGIYTCARNTPLYKC